jgi:hypothetical protein
MLFLIGLVMMVFAGSRLWPWWLPVAVFGAVAPLFVYQLAVVNAWRRETTPDEVTPIEFAGDLLLSFGALLGAYWIGRGLAAILGYWRRMNPKD